MWSILLNICKRLHNMRLNIRVKTQPFLCQISPLISSKIVKWHLHTDNSRPWWRHQMETFSALLALCAGNSPVPGEFPAQRPVTRGFDVFFHLRLNKRLSKQSWGWWLETRLYPLCRHCNDIWLRNGGVLTRILKLVCTQYHRMVMYR